MLFLLIADRVLPLVSESRGYSLVEVPGPLIAEAFLVAEHEL